MDSIVEIKNVNLEVKQEFTNKNIIEWFKNKLQSKQESKNLVNPKVNINIKPKEIVGLLFDDEKSKDIMLNFFNGKVNSQHGEIIINGDILVNPKLPDIKNSKKSNILLYTNGFEKLKYNTSPDFTYLLLSNDISDFSEICSRLICIKNNQIEYDSATYDKNISIKKNSNNNKSENIMTLKSYTNVVDTFLNTTDFVGNDKIETIYLHVGMPKTATSTIQSLAYVKKKYLDNKLSVLYPGYNIANNGVLLHSITMDEPENFYLHVQKPRNLNEVHNFNKKYVKIFIDEISKTTSKTVLFSGEALFFLKISEIERLTKFLNKVAPNANIKIVLCVREIANYTTSGYQQALKAGWNMKEYRSACGKGYYKNNISKFVNLFGRENCIIYKFEDAIASGDTTKYFFNRINLEDDILSDKSIAKINESVSDKACDLLKFINDEYPFTIGNKINDGRYLRDTLPIEDISGGKFSLDHEMESTYYNEFDIDLAYLESIGISYPKRDFRKKTILQFDEVYYDEFITAYNKMSDVLKDLMRKYIDNKIESTEIDKNSVEVLTRIKTQISNN